MKIFDPDNFNIEQANIYQETPLYTYRECTTCKIERKPKASHCATCNNCVVGYDHHCTLLNNCVGKRTLRAFNLLLINTWVFVLLSGMIGMISLLQKPIIEKLQEEGKIGFNYEVVVHILIFTLQIIKFIGICCCKNCI